MTFQISNLSCERQQKILFANLSLQLHAGDVLLVEGPNGSGKSSLLKLLCGLSPAEYGDIHWMNQSVLTTDFSQQLHYIGHVNGIKLGLTVLENLQLMEKLFGSPQAHIDSVLTQLNLITEKHALAKNLSAGQKRRVGLAKLFLFPRQLWILDEPFTALDVQLQALIANKIEEHALQGGIAIVSSHHAIRFNQIQAQTLRLPLC